MTSAIILAAGLSRRMGTQKLVLPFAGSTIIARVADAFLGAPVETAVVVVRPEDRQIRSALERRTVAFAENPDLEGDMLSSVRCGLRALPASTETIAVCPGDLPWLSPELIRELIGAYRCRQTAILVPVHGGRRGHPLLFAGRFREEVLTGYQGIGLRGWLDVHRAEVQEWTTEHAAVLWDVDTPEDFQSQR